MRESLINFRHHSHTNTLQHCKPIGLCPFQFLGNLLNKQWCLIIIFFYMYIEPNCFYIHICLISKGLQVWFIHKRCRKPKGQSGIDNPEKLTTLSTQYKGRRQTKQNTQHRKFWYTICSRHDIAGTLIKLALKANQSILTNNPWVKLIHRCFEIYLLQWIRNLLFFIFSNSPRKYV